MIKVSGTLAEMKELYKALGFVEHITRNGNIHYIDTDERARKLGFGTVKYVFNPKTGLCRRRTHSDQEAYILNSRKTVVNEYGHKIRVRIPIFNLAELMSRCVSPIVKYRQ